MTQAIGAAPLPLDPGWVVPAAIISANPADAARIERALDRLRTTESGREVADFLAAERVDIKVFPDAEFTRRFPGAGAIYDPKTRDIVMPQRATASSSLVTTLAHEGKHAMDFDQKPHWMLQSLQLIGGTAGDGVKALTRFDNPITAWLDSLTARQNEAEVDAYHLQARVAHELGRNESSWALGQAADGSPLPLDQVRSRVATDELYRMDPTRRLVLGAGLGVATTMLGTAGVQTIAGKVAPGSFLAKHAWPLYAIGGALTAGWVVSDQARARGLAARD